MPMLDYWLAHELVEEKPMGQDVLCTLQRASSPSEWIKRAAEFFNAKVNKPCPHRDKYALFQI